MTRASSREAIRTPVARRRRGALAAVCVLGLALGSGSVAQARLGDLDPSFDGDGVALPDVGPGAAQFEAVATRPDGRPVAAGSADSGEGLVVQLTGAGG
jgi:hypothetical protein